MTALLLLNLLAETRPQTPPLRSRLLTEIPDRLIHFPFERNSKAASPAMFACAVQIAGRVHAEAS